MGEIVGDSFLAPWDRSALVRKAEKHVRWEARLDHVNQRVVKHNAYFDDPLPVFLGHFAAMLTHSAVRMGLEIPANHARKRFMEAAATDLGAMPDANATRRAPLLLYGGERLVPVELAQQVLEASELVQPAA